MASLLFVVEGIDGANGEERTVSELISGESVVCRVPQTTTAYDQALISQLTNVDQANQLVSERGYSKRETALIRIFASIVF